MVTVVKLLNKLIIYSEAVLATDQYAALGEGCEMLLALQSSVVWFACLVFAVGTISEWCTNKRGRDNSIDGPSP